MASSIISQKPIDGLQSLNKHTYQLSHHLTGYLTWKVATVFCSLPPLSHERVRQLSINHLLDDHLASFSGWRVYLTRHYLVPFLDKHLPKTIEEALLKLHTVAAQEIHFPKELVHGILQDTLAYYNDVENASRLVVKNNILADSIDLSIEKALDQLAKENARSEESLLSLSTQKLLDEVIISALLSKIPGFLKLPTTCLLRAMSWTIQLLLFPFARLASPLLPTIRLADPTIEQLLMPGRIAACDFLNQLLRNLEQEWQHPTHPQLGLDKALLKRFLKAQIKIIQLSDCDSPEKLDATLKGGTLQNIADTIQDQYVLDDVCATIEEILAVAWKMIKSSTWRQRQLERFYSTMNHCFTAPNALSKRQNSPEQAVDALVAGIVRHKLSQGFTMMGKSLDKRLTPWFNWPSVKNHINNYANKYLGSSIQDTALNHLVPLACKANKTVTQKVAKFWGKPYSQRYGILHRHLLMRWLKT
ncbi:MAG: hypothetical protein KGZ39_02755 [Simkania sp.]|nr:hypothetical protein [Simkania sp.]